MFASFSSEQAATINSTYTGPTEGNWGDPATAGLCSRPRSPKT
jgi:hypothetical protein